MLKCCYIADRMVLNLLATKDFVFDLTAYPCQIIYQHHTVGVEHWDKFHAHPGLEFIYVHEGEGHVIIEQNIFPFQPGTLMFFQPFQLHRVKAELEPQSNYIRSKLLVEPSFLAPYLQGFPLLQRFCLNLWQNTHMAQVVYLSHPANELNRLFELFAFQEDGLAPHRNVPEEHALFVITFLRYLKAHLNSQTEDTVDRPARHLHYAELIMRWLDSHFREEFFLDKLAHDMHLSGCHLSHLFRKATGSTITEYLAFRRIQEACLLLRTTPLSIQEICGMVGITNVSYFCQLFRKKLGVTPARYRAKATEHS